MKEYSNKEHFKLIFDEYYFPIKNFLYYKLGDTDLAEDLTQEVFMKAWGKLDNIVMDTVRSYLYAIANNLAINHFKSARKKYEFKLHDQDRMTAESPEYIMETDEFAAQLDEAIKNLPESQRTAFLMNRIDGLTYQEIADSLKISSKAVEKRMHGALENLRTLIKIKF